MTESRTAYHASVMSLLLAAHEAAAAIRVQPAANGTGQRSTAEATGAVSSPVRCLAVSGPHTSILAALTVISTLPGDEGETWCPECVGRLRWSRDPDNRHVWGKCESDDCLMWMM